MITEGLNRIQHVYERKTFYTPPYAENDPQSHILTKILLNTLQIPCCTV